MSDPEDCARFLAEIAPKEGRERLAINTIDDYLAKHGGGRGELRRAFDAYNPAETPVTRTIRAKLDE